jgi:hypothetical protein
MGHLLIPTLGLLALDLQGQDCECPEGLSLCKSTRRRQAMLGRDHPAGAGGVAVLWSGGRAAWVPGPGPSVSDMHPTPTGPLDVEKSSTEPSIFSLDRFL